MSLSSTMSWTGQIDGRRLGSMNAQHRRWLITGAATGFGRALAEAVVAAGDAVVATARRPAALAGLAEHPSVTILTLDVTDGAQVRDVGARAETCGAVAV